MAAGQPAFDDFRTQPFAALENVLQGGNSSDWRKHCKITCTGPGNAVEELEGGKHCIGTFRVFCKVEVKGHKAMVGTKCEGMLLLFHTVDVGRPTTPYSRRRIWWL